MCREYAFVDEVSPPSKCPNCGNRVKVSGARKLNFEGYVEVSDGRRKLIYEEESVDWCVIYEARCESECGWEMEL